MQVVCLFKMLCLLTLCPVLLVAVQTLTIDSQLGTSIEDCFERLSIGEQLPRDAIYRNVSELTTRECEQLCKQDKQCQTYDYGVGAKGNATCNLSNVSEKELKEKNLLHRHPDYDVYVRRFQCEQSPPSPLQPQFDDPGEGPAHRPVFRPDEEDRRPLDDYLSDSRPFESIRPDLLKPIPPYRPPYHNHIDNDRPDDYNSQKPVFDAPPSYGAHKPQDIPYKPDKPQKPNRPYKDPYKDPYKPDPYDELHFQEQYKPNRPLNPGFWRPDPYHPPHLDELPDLYGQKPMGPPLYDPYGLEKPVYHYYVRPNRKPRPQHDSGYDRPGDYPTKPDPYGGNPARPIGPQDYRPSGYHSKPSYNYNSQYASNYGQSNYQDNSIYVEIYDPPRPYKPPKKPLNNKPYDQGGYGQNYGYGDQGSFGYGSHNSHNSFSQSQSSQYGQGTITEIVDGYNRPSTSGYGSSSFGGNSDTGYGSQSGYGSQKPSKPSYTNQGSYGSSQGSYGSTSSDVSYGGSQSYGGTKPSYSTSQIDSPGYGSSIQKPNDFTQRPAYGSHVSQGYGSSQDSNYGFQDSTQGYGNKPSYHAEHHNSESYGISQSSYEINRPGYSDNRPGYNRPSYGNDRPSYTSNRPIYDNDRPSYDNKPQYDRPSYGSKPSYDERPGYGNDSPSYGNKPSNDKPAYGNKPSYNNDRPIYDDDRPSYGSKPSSNKPPYSNDNERPSYGNDRPSYGNDRPSYGNDRPSYGNDRPPYGSDKPSYGHDKPSYGNDRPYDINRPDPPSNNRPSDSQDSGYGGQNTNTDDYKQQRPNETENKRPDIRPVFEYEFEKPSNVPSYIVRPGGEVITSRPVTVGDYGGRPAYGRDPGHEVSYKDVGTSQNEVVNITDTLNSENSQGHTEAPPPEASASDPPVDVVELDADLLLALGDAAEEQPGFGENIHQSVAQRWLPILKKGLAKEAKEKLLKEYLIPENCRHLKAPTLNPEISAAVIDIIRNRDKNILTKQDQLGQGIAAISKAITLLLLGDDKLQAIKILTDGCRILTDLHFVETQIRTKLITPRLEKSFLSLIQNQERDETLFGSNLAEKIKASKAIEKQSNQIKKPTASFKPATPKPTPFTSRSQYQGNWMGPPRYATSSRGGRIATGFTAATPAPFYRRPLPASQARPHPATSRGRPRATKQ